MNKINSHKIVCNEVSKIHNSELLANVIYNNFSYLSEFSDLMHNKKDILKTLQSENNLSYLLYDGPNLIAYLIGDFRTLSDNRYVYYMSYLYVSEKYRNKKIGYHLMKSVINKCKNVGAKFIILTCDTFDTKITGFYRKYGFKQDPILGNNSRHNVFCLYL
jgi:GNAT superfamily N-acetyltransferase